MIFRPEGRRLRLVDAVTGKPLPWHDEMEVALTRDPPHGGPRQHGSAEAKAAEEATARRSAEERVRALEAELERLRKG